MLDHLIPNVLQAYLTDCIVRQLAPKTIQSYKEILSQFTAWCGDIPIMEVDASRLRQYILDISQTHTPGGVHLRYRYIRTLLLWWENETDGTYRSPTHKVKPPKINREPQEPVPVEHVKALLATCMADYFGTRDKALITILLDTGARARELLHVELDSVDATLGTIQVLGKGSKTRTLYLGNTARKLLRKWMTIRPDCTYLWCDQSGTRLGYSGLRSVLARRARLAGIPSPKTHAFRRQFALSMLRAGVNTFTLAKLMGHSDTKTLERYLKLDYQDMELAQRQNSPADRL